MESVLRGHGNPLIEFRVLTYDDAERIRQWRNEDLAGLRTPYLLTETMQENWYRDVVSNRDSRARWWGIHYTETEKDRWKAMGFMASEPGFGCIGCAALESIEWENRRAEVSLLVVPSARQRGVGRVAVQELLRRAQEELNLHTVWGMVYYTTTAGDFWRKVLPLTTSWSVLPACKWWRGRWYDADLFTVLLSGLTGDRQHEHEQSKHGE